jgi:hypothetical protein
LLLIDKAVCLSAAKKEEYEAFRSNRQLLFCFMPFRHFPMNLSQPVDSARLFRREANYIKPPRPLARGRVTFREKSSAAA